MKIQSIRLQTRSLARIRSFYGERLGLQMQEDKGAVRVQAGRTQLIFQENPRHEGCYHLAFNIPCNAVEAAKTWLDEHGVALIPGLQGEAVIQFPNWHARSVYFFDPAGNILEFIARDDLGNATDQPFGPAAWLEASEIGIVTPDVAEWRAMATREWGIETFDKQPPFPAFAALGDDHGLFIVVQEGRPWFLTDIPATILPLEVEFLNDAGEYFHWRQS